MNVIKKERNSILKEKGLFIRELFKEKEEDYSSGIYYGHEPSYFDFFDDWDVIYPKYRSLVDDAIKSEKNGFILLYGESYVGKTCVAKRILVDFMKEGYNAIELGNVDSNNINLAFIDYLQNLPPNSKVALFVDDAAYQYRDLADIIQSCPENITHLVIVTEDVIGNHNIKKYHFKDLPKNKYYVNELHIKEEMNREYAKNVFEKLSEKKRLNRYLKHTPKNISLEKSRHLILEKMIDLGDIVDVLYYSSEGKKFTQHYEKLIEQKFKSYNKFLKTVCVLGDLGIEKIPNRLLSILPPYLTSSEIKNLFNQNPDEKIIYEERGKIRLRCRRIINDVLKNENSDVEEILRQTALST